MGIFRNAILTALKKKQMTQKHLADAIGVYPSNLNMFLKGTSKMPVDDIEKALDYLGLEVVPKRKHTVTIMDEGAEKVVEVKGIKLDL
jgi:transcriptional regulator with XRE-family HTH domain